MIERPEMRDDYLIADVNAVRRAVVERARQGNTEIQLRCVKHFRQRGSHAAGPKFEENAA